MPTERYSLRDSIIKTKKYKLYLFSGLVYTKDNNFICYLSEEILNYIRLNHEHFRLRRGNRNLEKIIENPKVFHDKYDISGKDFRNIEL